MGFGSIRQTLRNIEHHLLDSMSPGSWHLSWVSHIITITSH